MQAADSEESRDQRCPDRGARLGRPRYSQRGAGATVGLHDSSSSSSRLRSLMASSASLTGDEITYPPLAHLPRSITRQRSLQKGKSGSELLTDFLQIGQRSLTVRFRGMDVLIVKAEGRRQIIDFRLKNQALFRPSIRSLPPDRNRALR